jgi:deoxyhypusine synthase
LAWRLSYEPIESEESEDFKDPQIRSQIKTKIFLGYTSNLVSSGLRETLRFLAQHSLVQVIVTSAGGVEEDFIKCLAPTYVGSFNLSGTELRKRGLNRIGNLMIANDNYCKFEDWLMPILDEMLDMQRNEVILQGFGAWALFSQKVTHPSYICFVMNREWFGHLRK